MEVVLASDVAGDVKVEAVHVAAPAAGAGAHSGIEHHQDEQFQIGCIRDLAQGPVELIYVNMHRPQNQKMMAERPVVVLCYQQTLKVEPAVADWPAVHIPVDHVHAGL